MSSKSETGFFDAVKRKVDIVKVVGHYVPGLRAAGPSLKACCPFHNEKTPSFHVNQKRQIFFCFGCQKGGDSIGFVARIERLTPLQAAIRLARSARVPIPRAYRFLRRPAKLKPAIPTGFPSSLDSLLREGGLRRGDLTILAAPPTEEVSSLAQIIASNVALAKEPVLFFSFKLPCQAVQDRIVAFAANINPADVHDQCPALEKAEAQLHAAPLHIVHPQPTIKAIRAISGDLLLSLQKERKNLGLVILDPLHIIKAVPRRFPTRLEETAEILMEARMLAVNLNCAVLVVSQLPTRSEGHIHDLTPTEDVEPAGVKDLYEYDRHKHLGPWLLDLERAGIKDYDCSIILARDSSYHSDPARSEARLFVAQREEPWRECKIAYDSTTGAFSDFQEDGNE